MSVLREDVDMLERRVRSLERAEACLALVVMAQGVILLVMSLTVVLR